MLDKLFGWNKKEQPVSPNIRFGRYSDNNKNTERTNCWESAVNLFKEKRYTESIDTFFKYLRDDNADNVIFKRTGTDFTFELYQGSKIVRGTGNSKRLFAQVSLAKMPQPSVPVMRRLLEQNFSLFYSRYALDANRLCMCFDSDIDSASPNKLYYALKELSTKADKQDDLLVQDFASLQTLDAGHIKEMPAAEKETKFAFMQKWISETLNYIETLDADKFSGGIAYLLLTLAFRIDYLVAPQGSLQEDLNKICYIFFAKDEKPAKEKNNAMIGAYKTLLAISKEEVFKNLYITKSTFSIAVPQTQATIAESINNANNNLIWYRDNNYPMLAQQIAEYGISFCQYSYSLPQPLTQLFHLLMQVNYTDYFQALGFTDVLYESEANRFKTKEIFDRINMILNLWRLKYPKLDIVQQNLRFDSLLNFNHSFTEAMASLNFDV